MKNSFKRIIAVVLVLATLITVTNVPAMAVPRLYSCVDQCGFTSTSLAATIGHTVLNGHFRKNLYPLWVIYKTGELSVWLGEKLATASATTVMAFVKAFTSDYIEGKITDITANGIRRYIDRYARYH